MNSIAGRISAMGLVALATTYPQETLADGFDGAEFLTWSNAEQDSYIQTSVTMAAIIATKTRAASGDCIDAWYLDASADRTAKNAEIRSTIGRNSEFHPSAVIFLILEQETTREHARAPDEDPHKGRALEAFNLTNQVSPQEAHTRGRSGPSRS